MTNIPNALIKIRDTLANQHAHHPIQDNHASIKYGFDAACAELLPVIEESYIVLQNIRSQLCWDIDKDQANMGMIDQQTPIQIAIENLEKIIDPK